MNTMSTEARIARLKTFHAEGRIIRREWTAPIHREDGGDGRERACLLAAFSPEAARDETAHACPAQNMPRWLADVTPLIDDCGSPGSWESVIARYVDVIGKVLALPLDRLGSLCIAFKRVCNPTADARSAPPHSLASARTHQVWVRAREAAKPDLEYHLCRAGDEAESLEWDRIIEGWLSAMEAAVQS